MKNMDERQVSVARRRRFLRTMAWLCAVLVLCITSLSAYMRLSKEAPPCIAWPQCVAQAEQAGAAIDTTVVPAQSAAMAQTPGALKLIHRTVASATLLLLLLMLVVAWFATPRLWAEALGVTVLLALTAFLAVLGRWSSQPGMPAVVLGNLVAGLLMFAMSVRLACQCVPGGARSVRGRGAWLLWGCALLVCAQVALGGLVSARHAGLVCPVFGDCAVDFVGGWQALEFWKPTASTLTQEQGAFLQLLHRGLGALLVLVLWFVSWRLWRGGQIAAAAILLVLALLQPLIGLAVVASEQQLAVMLLHNLMAVMLLALVMALTVSANQQSSWARR